MSHPIRYHVSGTADASVCCSATAFAFNWQREQLVSLNGGLMQSVTPEEIISKVLGCSIRLLRADTATLSLLQPSCRQYRTAAAGPQAGLRRQSVGPEIPSDFPPRVLAGGMIALPDDDPQSPLVPLLARTERGGLYTALRHGGEVIGILDVTRRADLRFDTADRLLARGLADQAALALTTARVHEDLRRAREVQSEIVGIISHALRTSLTTLLGGIEVLEDTTGDHADMTHHVSRIQGAGLELLDLVENMLIVGKIAAAREDLRLEPVSLRRLWQSVRDRCQRLPRRPDVRLEWSDSVPDVSLITDTPTLTRVLHHVIGNALKFTEQGAVRISAVVAGAGDLILRVADTGVGVRPEHQAHIFEPFWQADASSTRRFGGIGLGLYVVHQCVEQLGGTVEVTSAANRGSVFSVTLPHAIVRAADRVVPITVRGASTGTHPATHLHPHHRARRR